MFGLDDNGSDTGSLLDFFSDIGTDSVTSVMKEAAIPLAKETIWTYSGDAWLLKV